MLIAALSYGLLLVLAGAGLALAPQGLGTGGRDHHSTAGPPSPVMNSLQSPPEISSAGPAASQVISTYCSGEADLVYRIEEKAFRPYQPDCVYANQCTLLSVPIPPAPVGWNQPGFRPDDRWVQSVRVWWDAWNADWDPGRLGCGQPIGLHAYGRQDGQNGTTHLFRRLFTVATPPGTYLKQAVLQMWSDNKSEWWWDGESVQRNQEGHIGALYLTDQVSRRLQEGSESSFLLAVQVSNDWVPQGPGTDGNPQGAAYRLELTWESRNYLYLPVLVRQFTACSWYEEFPKAEVYTAIPSERPPGQIITNTNPLSAGTAITLSGTGSRYLWRQIPVLSTGDFTVTAVLSLTTQRSDGGVAVALRSGAPSSMDEEHILSPSDPGVMIGIAHNESRCNAPFDHIFAEWITSKGTLDTTHTRCIRGRDDGVIIPIQQQVRYEARIEILRSQGKVILSVFGPWGSVTTRSIEVSSTLTLAPLDTLVLGHALNRAYRTDREFYAWIDSVVVLATDCDWNSEGSVQ